MSLSKRERCLILVAITAVGIIFYFIYLLKNIRIFEAIGLALFVSSFTNIIFELLVKEQSKSSLTEHMPCKRTTDLFPSAFKKAKSKVDIITSSGKTMRNDYKYDFLEKIIKESCTIRILILNPSSVAVMKRDQDCHDPNGTLTNDIEETIEYFRELEKKAKSKKIKGKLDVVQYNEVPYFAYTKIDDVYFWTPYTIGLKGKDCPVIEVDNKTKLHDNLDSHFDKIFYRYENDKMNLIISIHS